MHAASISSWLIGVRVDTVTLSTWLLLISPCRGRRTVFRPISQQRLAMPAIFRFRDRGGHVRDMAGLHEQSVDGGLGALGCRATEFGRENRPDRPAHEAGDRASEPRRAVGSGLGGRFAAATHDHECTDPGTQQQDTGRKRDGRDGQDVLAVTRGQVRDLGVCAYAAQQTEPRVRRGDDVNVVESPSPGSRPREVVQNGPVRIISVRFLDDLPDRKLESCGVRVTRRWSYPRKPVASRLKSSLRRLSSAFGFIM
jgi:hypothetical protein